VFVFQAVSQAPVGAKKTLADMEKELMRLNTSKPAELAAFLSSVQKFASTATDAKSQAFCYQSGVWLAERGVKDASIKALLDMGKNKLADASLENAIYHCQNYFAVADASRSSDGAMALSAQAVNKLTMILDKAQKNFLADPSQQESTTDKSRYYFRFDTKAQADEFATSVLGALPADFNPIVGTAADRLGKEYVQNNKGIANSYVVEFTCEYTDKFPLPGAKAPIKKASTPFMQPSFTIKPLTFRMKAVGETNAYTEAAIKDYAAKSNFKNSAYASGLVEVSGTASLFYGRKYQIDLDKDSKSAKNLATEAVRQLLAKYEIALKEPLETFFASKDGQNALAILNKNYLDVQGWASMEVFAVMAGKDCKNYDALKKAIIENWQLAHDRANLVYSYIDKINKSLSQQGLNTIKISESDLKPNLYFFQALAPELMDKLIADKDISKNTSLRDWLNSYKGAQKGEEHMGQLLSYLQENGGNAEYGKLKAALDKNDFALLNRYWQRTQNDRLGMRNESRDSQSLLVQAIENSGNGNSRSTMLSSLTQAHIGLEISRINYDLELEKGEKCQVDVEIKESRSVQDVDMKINAYLVDKDNSVIPLALQPNGKYTGEVEAAGDYTFVAYAQNKDGGIATRLVGQKITVTEKAEPPPPPPPKIVEMPRYIPYEPVSKVQVIKFDNIFVGKFLASTDMESQYGKSITGLFNVLNEISNTGTVTTAMKAQLEAIYNDIMAGKYAKFWDGPNGIIVNGSTLRQFFDYLAAGEYSKANSLLKPGTEFFNAYLSGMMISTGDKAMIKTIATQITGGNVQISAKPIKLSENSFLVVSASSGLSQRTADVVFQDVLDPLFKTAKQVDKLYYGGLATNFIFAKPNIMLSVGAQGGKTTRNVSVNGGNANLLSESDQVSAYATVSKLFNLGNEWLLVGGAGPLVRFNRTKTAAGNVYRETDWFGIFDVRLQKTAGTWQPYSIANVTTDFLKDTKISTELGTKITPGKLKGFYLRAGYQLPDNFDYKGNNGTIRIGVGWTIKKLGTIEIGGSYGGGNVNYGQQP
jgi:hypothetical protein